MPQLRITEIFHSLQGEARSAGIPTVFVRLTGCPLRCQYCDTAYAFSGGELMSFEAILDEIRQFECPTVCVTGGEPLAQVPCNDLLHALCEEGFEVSLETSGAMSLEQTPTEVSRVVDIKTPGSQESHRNLWGNIDYLTANDQLKFVICSREDYEWSRFKLDEYQLTPRVSDVLFSPSHHDVKASDLADWIVADRLPVRFQMQLHKMLWNDEPGR